MEEESLVDAILEWCPPDFAAAVHEAGIHEVVESTADVEAVRSIYVRRRRHLSLGSPLIGQVEGILKALDALPQGDFLMVRFRIQEDLEGIVMATVSGTPVFAFPLRGI